MPSSVRPSIERTIHDREAELCSSPNESPAKSSGPKQGWGGKNAHDSPSQRPMYSREGQRCSAQDQEPEECSAPFHASSQNPDGRSHTRPATASGLRAIRSVHEARARGSRPASAAATVPTHVMSHQSHQMSHQRQAGRNGRQNQTQQQDHDGYVNPFASDTCFRPTCGPQVAPGIFWPPLRDTQNLFVKYGPPHDHLFYQTRNPPPERPHNYRLPNQPPLAGYSKGVGMSVREADCGRLVGGVVVTYVKEGDRAHQAGIKVGDMIIGMDHQTIHNRHDLRQALETCRPVVMLTVRRGVDTIRFRMRR
eukprot:TRINITY_DN5521_c0_g1::TRINITY_DN5521_c0_g1_i1::g.9390::m.9390 TRINITY_DN5521_c0_g1::TRINITY_DN5521_c0_g1_i1::g.9390  ORF type:complete len:308 (-),score=26.21,sp/P0C0V0/DEGP_ECOLI/43.08/2e-07,PDZ_2/PF13180.1/1.6e-07,PDZ/PF00595.19/2.2e-07,GRASP55_65/PF04495.9/0.093 TRINITY_DN5521_c0_g1_i1:920-1843(-)